MIVQKLIAKVVKALQNPELRQKMTLQLGMEVVGGSPAKWQAFMAKENSALG